MNTEEARSLSPRPDRSGKRIPAWDRADEIIAVVIDILERDGYDAVQVRTVAKRARMSLATIYKLFGTRDELLISAVEKWMDAHVYVKVAPPDPTEDPYGSMVRILRSVFAPWEHQPLMLEAFHRASNRPGGERLHIQGAPIIEDLIQGVDATYAQDLQLIMWHMVRSVLDRFAAAELAITEIVPVLERALFRLTADNRSAFQHPPAADSPDRPEDITLR